MIDSVGDIPAQLRHALDAAEAAFRQRPGNKLLTFTDTYRCAFANCWLNLDETRSYEATLQRTLTMADLMVAHGSQEWDLTTDRVRLISAFFSGKRRSVVDMAVVVERSASSIACDPSWRADAPDNTALVLFTQTCEAAVRVGNHYLQQRAKRQYFDKFRGDFVSMWAALDTQLSCKFTHLRQPAALAELLTRAGHWDWKQVDRDREWWRAILHTSGFVTPRQFLEIHERHDYDIDDDPDLAPHLSAAAGGAAAAARGASSSPGLSDTKTYSASNASTPLARGADDASPSTGGVGVSPISIRVDQLPPQRLSADPAFVPANPEENRDTGTPLELVV